MRPLLRWSLIILLMVAAGLSAWQWFTIGVTASKFIGMPEFASAMAAAEKQSNRWGFAALLLEAVAIVLAITAPRKSNAYELSNVRWLSEIRVVRAAAVLVGTVGSVLVYVLVVYLAAYYFR